MCVVSSTFGVFERHWENPSLSQQSPVFMNTSLHPTCFLHENQIIMFRIVLLAVARRSGGGAGTTLSWLIIIIIIFNLLTKSKKIAPSLENPDPRRNAPSLTVNLLRDAT